MHPCGEGPKKVTVKRRLTKWWLDEPARGNIRHAVTTWGEL